MFGSCVPAQPISIHAPLRERRTAAGVNLVVSLFQSTLPCGSDAPFLYLNSGYADFNPRSLAGATGKTKVLIVSITHFNPRSLAGATGLYLRSKRHEKISIHAPLRERPYPFCFTCFPLTISIHAPLRERQNCITRLVCTLLYFNPRSLTGATAYCRMVIAARDISIHAPLRERQLN